MPVTQERQRLSNRVVICLQVICDFLMLYDTKVQRKNGVCRTFYCLKRTRISYRGNGKKNGWRRRWSTANRRREKRFKSHGRGRVCGNSSRGALLYVRSCLLCPYVLWRIFVAHGKRQRRSGGKSKTRDYCRAYWTYHNFFRVRHHLSRVFPLD